MSEKDRARPSRQKWAILLVDDHPIMRQGLRELIGMQNDMTVCAEAMEHHEALQLMEEHQPDAAVVDLTLGDGNGNGMDMVKDIRTRHPSLPFLVCSMRDESVYAEQALQLGANGYVSKTEPCEKVVEGLRLILRGHTALSDRVTSRVMKLSAADGTETILLLAQSLSDREMEIFKMIGKGLSPAEISSRLNISAKTVESHREHIKHKMHFQSAQELLKQAIGWAESGPTAE